MPIIATAGDMRAVFRFELYDVTKDEFKVSRRLATMATIQRINGRPTGPSYEVPNSDLDDDGLTAIDYDPRQCTK